MKTKATAAEYPQKISCSNMRRNPRFRKKHIRRFLFLLLCAEYLLLPLASASAAVEGCEGRWLQTESARDGWGPASTGEVVNNGTTLGFWLDPTSCTDEVYIGSIHYSFTKRLACVPPQLVKLAEAKTGGSCKVDEANAITQPGLQTDDPCVTVNFPFSSDYGEVTIAHGMKKYLWVCNQQPVSEEGNYGPPACPITN